MQFLDGVPDILFKYRNYKDPFHRDVLLKREIFFATPNMFNDPYDAAIPHRYKKEDLTEDKIFLKYRDVTKRENPSWREEQVHEHCYEYQRRGLLKDEHHVEKVRKQTIETFATSYGIVSLSKDPYNFLMWSHYSHSHTGYCIGFDKYHLYQAADAKFAHVDYCDTIPEIGLFEDSLHSMHKLTYTKANFWAYEKEYRLASIKNARKKVELPPEAIKVVVLGLKMPQSEKFEILDVVEKNYKHAEVYDVTLNKRTFELNSLRIF